MFPHQVRDSGVVQMLYIVPFRKQCPECCGWCVIQLVIGKSDQMESGFVNLLQDADKKVVHRVFSKLSRDKTNTQNLGVNVNNLRWQGW